MIVVVYKYKFFIIRLIMMIGLVLFEIMKLGKLMISFGYFLCIL